MDKELILLERQESHAVITFNRPEKLNALSSPMVEQFQAALEECRGRYAAIVVTGAGKAFCAGVDLRERNEWVRKGAKIRGDSVRNKWYDTIGTIIRNHPAIFIVAVNGLCLGGGVTLVNIADIALMADEAEIGIPQITFGIYPGVAGASAQMRTLKKRFAWPILTGDRIDAQTAVDTGLVNMAVPRDRLMDEANQLGARIGRFDPIALDWSKKALDQIPSHISEWSVALEYGYSVNSVIQDQIKGSAA